MWPEPRSMITVVLTIDESTETVFATVVSPGGNEFDVGSFCG